MSVKATGPLESVAMLARTESIAHVGSWEWEIAEDRVHWSQELFRLFGLDPAAAAPSYAEHGRLFLPEDMETLSRAVDLCRIGGTPYVRELSILRSDGAVRRCISRGEAVRDNAGRIHRLVGSFQDITEILEAQEEIRRNALRLSAIVDILQYRPESLQDLLTQSLDKAVKLTRSRIGYIYFYDEDRCEFTLNTWSGDAMAECAVQTPNPVQDLARTGIWGEAVRQRKAIIVNDFEAPNPLRKGVPEGHANIRRFLTIPVFFRDRIVAVVGVANKPADYTETDQLELTLLMDSVWKSVEAFRGEEALRRMEWLLARRPVADSEPFVPPYGDIAGLNPGGLILSSVGKPMLTDIVSDSISLLATSAAVYETKGDYALLHICSDWCRLLDAASRRLCRTEDNRAALTDGRWLCHETCWNRAARAAMESGRAVDIECPGMIRLYALPIFSGEKVVGAIHFAYGDPPRNPALLRRLAERFEVDETELARSAESYEPRPPFIVEVAKKQLEASARLIGEIVQRRQTELERERFRAQLLQAQKMESVGRLAGGVAHDFNNALNVILGFSEQALERLPESDPLRADLEEIHRAARRSAAVTRQLLGFARKQTIHPETLDLNGAMERMLRMLEHLIGENILLSWHPAPDLWHVAMDPSQVEQILADLCINARDAMEGAGRITIETANVHFEEGEAGAPEGSAVGDYALLSVADTGRGMDREILDNLFEPFFTTKGPGKGTGLGLPTIYGIVRQNRGFILVDSRPGEGSVFRVYLPRDPASPSEARASKGSVRPDGASRSMMPGPEALLPMVTPSRGLPSGETLPGAVSDEAASSEAVAAIGGTAPMEIAHIELASTETQSIGPASKEIAPIVLESMAPSSMVPASAPEASMRPESAPLTSKVHPPEAAAPAVIIGAAPSNAEFPSRPTPPARPPEALATPAEAPASKGRVLPDGSPRSIMPGPEALLPIVTSFGELPSGATSPGAASAEGVATEGDTVLLVEDEPAVLRLARKMIERLGYHVIDAGSPAEALELARRHAPRLKLLVTDVIMPEMNGRTLAERLLPLRPELKVLFMSGYTADVIARSGMLDPGTHFIQKPFSRQDLSAKILEALEG